MWAEYRIRPRVSMPTLSIRAAYPWAVIAAGALALAAAAGDVRWYPLDPRWIVLCTLTLVGSVATLKMRAAPVSFSISDTFTFTTLLLLGPGPATITASLEALTISCFLSREHRRATRILFNIAAVGLAMWIAGAVLVALEGGQGAGSLARQSRAAGRGDRRSGGHLLPREHLDRGARDRAPAQSVRFSPPGERTSSTSVWRTRRAATLRCSWRCLLQPEACWRC